MIIHSHKIFFLYGLLILCNLSFGQAPAHTSTITAANGNIITWKYFAPEYPKGAKEASIEGEVRIVFDIDSTCTLKNRQVTQGIGGGCDEAAIKKLDQSQAELKKRYKSSCPVIKTVPYIVHFRLK